MGVGIEIDGTAKGASLRGTVAVEGIERYDGVSISAQVIESNSLVSFVSCNEKDAGGSKSRHFVPRADMPGGRIKFAARLEPEVKGIHEVRVRASVIEQHKEVESGLVFAIRGGIF